MRKLEQHVMHVVCESEYNFVLPPTPEGNYTPKKENSEDINDLVGQWREYYKRRPTPCTDDRTSQRLVEAKLILI